MSDTSLFSLSPRDEPLAARMRPRTIDEFIGQDHILGPGRLLRRAIQADQLSSIILSGPPGTGKTTLARVIANTTKSSFTALNAVLSGVKDVRAAIETAKDARSLYGRRTILFVDEVHRWNKAQQDALLPWVENGTFILIGATTENPFFEVNSALISRSRVFQLRPLSNDDLYAVARFALRDPDRGYGRFDVKISDDALDHLVSVADGDARSLLNALELAVETSVEPFPPADGSTIAIDLAIAEESIQKKAVLYDKEGDYHYDIISAFIKSLRGSDPDAAMYWLARMIAGGEDPRFLFRRMLILASEDVGMADPNALSTVHAAAAAFERVGLPEGEYFLSHAALYLATAEKSNTTMGYFDAKAAVEREKDGEVPKHLKDASRDAEGMGHGEGYNYPHAYRDHWVAQAYLPQTLRGRVFYQPSERGYEGTIRDTVLRRRELQLAAMNDDDDIEILTFTPTDRGRESWRRRVSGARTATLAAIRDAVFDAAGIARHHRVVVLGSDPGVFVWEAMRRAPEGLTVAIVADDQARDAIEAHAANVAEIERPVVFAGDLSAFATARAGAAESAELAERVVARNVAMREPDKTTVFRTLAAIMSEGAVLSTAESIPRRAQRLSSLLATTGAHRDVIDAVGDVENVVFSDRTDPRFNWDVDDLTAALDATGFVDVEIELRTFDEKRRIKPDDAKRWFGEDGGVFAREFRRRYAALAERATDAALSLTGAEIPWSTTVAILRAHRPKRPRS